MWKKEISKERMVEELLRLIGKIVPDMSDCTLNKENVWGQVNQAHDKKNFICQPKISCTFTTL